MDRLSINRHGRPHATVLSGCVSESFNKALACDTRLHPAFLIQQISGFPGQRYRGFINNLIGAISDARYLEIGSGTGFSAYAAIYNNNVAAICIDEWSLKPGTHAVFVAMMANSEPTIRNVETIDADARTVDFTRVRRSNVYLYDQTRAPRADGLKMALPALDDEFIYITNNWNNPVSKKGVDTTIRTEGLSQLFAISIRTTDDGKVRETPDQAGDRMDDFFVGVFRKKHISDASLRIPK